MDTKPKLNLSKSSAGEPPWRTILALSVLVVAAHLGLLIQGPFSLGLDARQAPISKLSLSTRTITAGAEQTMLAVSPRENGRQPPTADSGRSLAMEQPASPLEGLRAASPSPPVIGSAPEGTAPAPMPAASSPTAAESAPPTPIAGHTDTPSPAQAQGLERSETPTMQAGPRTPTMAPEGAPERRPALVIPGSAKLNYQLTGRIRGLDYTAHGQLEWLQDGQRYQARLTVGMLLLPSRSQSSVGDIGAQGLSPRRFSDRSRGESAIHFQPELGRITFSNNSPSAVWLAGTQDRLSLSMQLAAMIAGDPSHFTPGTTVSIPTAGTRSVEPWDFTVMSSESLSLPVGTHTAIRLKREPRNLYDQTLEIWFAPALGFLPVRIQLSQSNGDLVDQRLAGIERP